MSFFDRHAIPEWLLHLRVNEEGKATDTSTRWLAGLKRMTRRVQGRRKRADNPSHGKFTRGENETDEDSSFFLQDVTLLREYSFVSIGQDPTVFEMHRLVQLATRMWLEDENKAEEWRVEFIQRLLNAFPDADYEAKESERKEIGYKLLPHVETAIGHRPSSDGAISKWSDLLLNAAFFMFPENPKIMLKMATAAMEARKRIYGSNNQG